MATFTLKTYDADTRTTIATYPDVEGLDADDACAVLSAKLVVYPGYLPPSRAHGSWGVRVAKPNTENDR